MPEGDTWFFLQLGSRDEHVLGTDSSKLLLFYQNPLNPTFAGVGLMGVDTGTLWGHGGLWEQPLGTAPLFPAEHRPSLEQFIISLSLSFSCAFVCHN